MKLHNSETIHNLDEENFRNFKISEFPEPGLLSPPQLNRATVMLHPLVPSLNDSVSQCEREFAKYTLREGRTLPSFFITCSGTENKILGLTLIRIGILH